ncbi:MAG TPA: hypothetical protein VFR97_06625 [Capillimicrobium sp.]|nr:hypothetical protein [Capillimicrobium sp.]
MPPARGEATLRRSTPIQETHVKNNVLCLLLATAAALGAAVPAEAARETYGSKWRVASVKLDGDLRVSELSDTDFTAEGKARYRGGRGSKAFDIKLSNRRSVAVVASGLDYTASTTATISDSSGKSWDCSYVADELFTPATLAAVLVAGPNGITINWSLVPPAWACPDDAPQSPSIDMPSQGFATKHPLRAFTGKTARLPIKIHAEGGNRLASSWELDWRGTVVLKRVGAR